MRVLPGFLIIKVPWEVLPDSCNRKIAWRETGDLHNMLQVDINGASATDPVTKSESTQFIAWDAW